MGQTIQTQPSGNNKLFDKINGKLQDINELIMTLNGSIIVRHTYYIALKTNNSLTKGDICLKTEKINLNTNTIFETFWINKTRNLEIDNADKISNLLLELTDNKYTLFGENIILKPSIVSALNIPNADINYCTISVNEGKILLTTDGKTKPNSEDKTGLLYSEGSIIKLTSKYTLTNVQICSADVQTSKIYVEYGIKL